MREEIDNMESSEDKNQTETIREYGKEQRKWDPKCPKCRRKVYTRIGKHINTLRMASGEGDSSQEPNREHWYEFRCKRCEFNFALHRESVEEHDLLTQVV